MREDNEVELKLDFPEGSRREVEDCQPLRAAQPQRQKKFLRSVYFDTPKAKLRRAGISLRVRSDGETHIQTVKSSASASRGRREWEWEIKGTLPDLKAAKQTGLRPFFSKKLERKLHELFATRVERTIYPLASGDNLIELAFDEGDVTAEQRAEPIREIEVELKKGEPSQLFALARELSERAPLRLVTRSKSTRGYDLLSERPSNAAVKAVETVLERKADVEVAFQAIANTCLAQITDNYAAVARGDPEGVHQMRVGLRRLRAAMSLFKAILKDKESVRIKNGLKWLTEELGPARQLQVYKEGVVQRLSSSDDRDGAFCLFEKYVRDRLTEANERAKQAVSSDHFRMLLLDVAEWIDTGYWRLRKDRTARRSRARAASKFSRRELAKRSRKIVKRGKDLRTLSARERHKLRIACKKLRYGSEFFASLLPHKKEKPKLKTLKQLKDLLDCLGALNDVSAHQALSASMIGEKGGNRSVNIAFDAGRAAATEACRTNSLLRASVRMHCKFSASKAARSFA